MGRSVTGWAGVHVRVFRLCSSRLVTLYTRFFVSFAPPFPEKTIMSRRSTRTPKPIRDRFVSFDSEDGDYDKRTGSRSRSNSNASSTTSMSRAERAALRAKKAASDEAAEKLRTVEEEDSSSGSDSEPDVPKKQQLLSSSDSEPDEDGGVPDAGFTDENKSWLKVKKKAGGSTRSSSSSSSDDEEADAKNDSEYDSDDDEDYDIEKKSRHLDKKKAQEAKEAAADIQQSRNVPEEDRYDLEKDGGVVDDYDDDDAEAEEYGEQLDISQIKDRIGDIVQVLSDFRNRRQAGKSRTDYLDQLKRDVSTYYGYNDDLADMFLRLFSPAEAIEFFESNEKPRPIIIRTNTLKTRRRDLAQALINRGVQLDPLAEWTKVGLKIYNSNVPIGATPEYMAGHYILQAASSFMPCMALAPQPGERVLDMCAAPGGKTTYLAQMMRNQGLVVANDFKIKRTNSLMGNIQRLGVKIALVCNYDGRAFPRVMGGFDRVLLDAPCSGLGVISHDASIKSQRTIKDIERTVHLQKELLLAAIDSVDATSKTGGIIVYSTCSVSVEEDECVVDYALRKRCVKLVDTGLTFGKEGMTKYCRHRFNPNLNKTRRYFPHVHNMDGFYVAKFVKYSNSLPPSAAEDDDEVAGDGMEANDAEGESQADDADDKDRRVALVTSKGKGGKVLTQKVLTREERKALAAEERRKRKREDVEGTQAQKKGKTEGTVQEESIKESQTSDKKNTAAEKKDKKAKKKKKKEATPPRDETSSKNSEVDKTPSKEPAVEKKEKKKKKKEKKDDEKPAVPVAPPAEMPVPEKELPSFVPSKKFKGAQRGYVFKMDRKGLGYYKDRKPATGKRKDRTRDGKGPAPDKRSAVEVAPSKVLVPFVPAKRFKGAQQGYVFKMGNDGLGYYKDKKPIPVAGFRGDGGGKRSSGKKKNRKKGGGGNQRRGGGRQSMMFE